MQHFMYMSKCYSILLFLIIATGVLALLRVKVMVSPSNKKVSRCAWCVIFCILSAGTMLSNKLLMEKKYMEPFGVTAFQMASASTLFSVIAIAEPSYVAVGTVPELAKYAATVPFLFFGMLTTSMQSIKHASMGTVIVFRNINPLISFFVESLIQRSMKMTPQRMASMLLILVGIIIYACDDITAGHGLMWILLNSVFTVCEHLLLRFWMSHQPISTSKLVLSYVNNLIGFCLCVVVVWHDALRPIGIYYASDGALLAFTSCAGALLGLCGLHVQKQLSATNFMILSNLNKVVILIMGMVFWNEPSSPRAICGLLIALSCGVWYGRTFQTVDTFQHIDELSEDKGHVVNDRMLQVMSMIGLCATIVLTFVVSLGDCRFDIKYDISITTIPSRAKYIGPVIDSFMTQHVPPNRIFIHVPETYERFPNASLRDGDFPESVRHNGRVVINHIGYDYGPATKVFGLRHVQLDDHAILLITDDDTPKLPQWSKALIESIIRHADGLSTMHPSLIYGGRGYGFIRSSFDLEQAFTQWRNTTSCRYVDDYFFTRYLQRINVSIHSIAYSTSYIIPESVDFDNKLRDLDEDLAREHLRELCDQDLLG